MLNRTSEEQRAMVTIWYQYEGRKPERLDSAHTQREAERLVAEYRMAFGLLPGQHRHSKDKVWAGKKEGGKEPCGTS